MLSSRLRMASFTRKLAGSYTSLIRSGFGADEWKIIRPGAVGDWILPLISDQTYRNRNKRFVMDLALKCDALKEKFKNFQMKNFRLGNEQNGGSLSCSDQSEDQYFTNRAPGGCASLFEPPSAASYQRNPLTRRWSYDDGEPEDQWEYGPGGYHPVRIGEIYHQRYHVIRKLGWGSSSTAWLCWDEEGRRFVALKIVRSAERYTAAAIEEVEDLSFYALLQMLLVCEGDNDGEHPKRVVQLFDEFTIDGPNGTHVCLVLEAFGGDVVHLISGNNFSEFQCSEVREIIRQVLEGLCHLHENNIVHTDIKPENLLFSARNELKQKALEALAFTEQRLCNADKFAKVDCPDIYPDGGRLFQLKDLAEAIGDAVYMIGKDMKSGKSRSAIWGARAGRMTATSRTSRIASIAVLNSSSVLNSVRPPTSGAPRVWRSS